MKYFYLAASSIILAYIGISIFIYFYQRNLLYHPNENNYFGDNLKIEIDRIKIKTSDNLDLNAWYYEKDKNEFKTLLFLTTTAFSKDPPFARPIDLNFSISSNKQNVLELNVSVKSSS